MNLQKVYTEEDLFPREIASWEEREYGVLFYNEENKDSYDSNHALIFRDKVTDLGQVLADIVSFYSAKGIRSNVYQSIFDEGYFEEIRSEFIEHGFESWTEEQRYMILSEENAITPNPEIVVEKVSQWREEFAEIFELAEEPWEIAVFKRALENSNTLCYVAFYEGKPAGIVHSHITDGVWRGDYLLVATPYRNKGIGRALMYNLVEYCHANQIEDCCLWVTLETAEKIYHEAGFRYIGTRKAGRAFYKQ